MGSFTPISVMRLFIAILIGCCAFGTMALVLFIGKTPSESLGASILYLITTVLLFFSVYLLVTHKKDGSESCEDRDNHELIDDKLKYIPSEEEK